MTNNVLQIDVKLGEWQCQVGRGGISVVWEKGVCEVVRCVLPLWADWFQPAIRSISTAYIAGEIYRSIVNGFPQQTFFWNGENDCVSVQSCLSRGGLVYATSPEHIPFPARVVTGLLLYCIVHRCLYIKQKCPDCLCYFRPTWACIHHSYPNFSVITVTLTQLTVFC